MAGSPVTTAYCCRQSMATGIGRWNQVARLTRSSAFSLRIELTDRPRRQAACFYGSTKPQPGDQSTDAQETLGLRNEVVGSVEKQGRKALPSLAGFRQHHGRRKRHRGKNGDRQRDCFDALRSKVLFAERLEVDDDQFRRGTANLQRHG